MKKLTQMSFALAIAVGLGLAFPSCKSQETKDAEAKTKIEATLVEGTSVSVENGVATISGIFPDEASRLAAEEKAKSVSGVTSVVNNGTVAAPPAPVTVTGDPLLTEGVNAVVAGYDGVSATVAEGVITLNGSIKKEDLPKLMQALNELHPKKIEQKLVVK